MNFGAQSGALWCLLWRWVGVKHRGTVKLAESWWVQACACGLGGARGATEGAGACGLSTEAWPPHLGGTEALWFWAPAQLLGAL